MKLFKGIGKMGSKIVSEAYTFVREAAAGATGEIVTEGVKEKAKDKRGEVVAAIENIADPQVRDALWEIHNFWWKVKDDENKFVEEIAKIPEKYREDILTRLAYLWAAGQQQRVEQFFYALEHDWWQQLLKKPFKLVKNKVDLNAIDNTVAGGIRSFRQALAKKGIR